MASSPRFAATPRFEPTQFVPEFNTRPRIIFAPGSSGSVVRNLSCASADDTTNTIQFAVARRLTTAAGMVTGSLVDNGVLADRLTRSSGSFVTDGWLVGNRLLIQGATTLANDVEVILSAVTALALSGTTGGGDWSAAEDLPSESAIYRLSYLSWQDVPAGAGSASVNARKGFDSARLPIFSGEFFLGSNNYLVAALGAALTGTEIIDITVEGDDF